METEPEPAEGDQIIIFQHPQARPKEFSVDKILDIKKPFVQYRADTDDGSSGSPVVTTTGLKLIAVHHGGKAESYNKGTLCSEILVHLRTGTCKWHISCLSFNHSKLQGRIQEFLKGGLYTIDVTFITNGVEGQ